MAGMISSHAIIWFWKLEEQVQLTSGVGSGASALGTHHHAVLNIVNAAAIMEKFLEAVKGAKTVTTKWNGWKHKMELSLVGIKDGSCKTRNARSGTIR